MFLRRLLSCLLVDSIKKAESSIDLELKKLIKEMKYECIKGDTNLKLQV